VTYDTTTTSFTLALDKLTGEPRWKADRTSLIHSPQGELLEGYSTPIILEHAGRPQLVNHAGYYLSGYDLPTGKELWHFQCASYAVVVTPVSWKDVIIVGGASNATRSRCLQAVQLTQESDGLSATALWRARRNFPDVSTPVVYGEHVYTVTNKGIAACLEANTGKVCWTERLNGNYEASLVAGDGKLFFCNVEGETTVVAAGPEFKVLSQNAVREPVRASFAISGCRIFIRGDRHLFCIGGNA
jgi:outer membrane protein assembly factor BamB